MNGMNVLIAFALGFVAAQVMKILILLVRRRGRISLRELAVFAVKSGGMPSGHAASLSAATVAVGRICGFMSVECAMMVCVLVIALYDAVNVRWAVGEQGKVLAREHPELKVVEGHTVVEVVVGLVIGILVGIISSG